MPNANKIKGTRFESDLRDHASARKLSAFRPAPMGVGDIGDVHIAGLLCVQAKDVTSWNVSGWIAAVKDQAIRAGLPFPVVVMKKRRAPVGEAYAVLTYDSLLNLVDRLALAERFAGADPYVRAQWLGALEERLSP